MGPAAVEQTKKTRNYRVSPAPERLGGWWRDGEGSGDFGEVEGWQGDKVTLTLGFKDRLKSECLSLNCKSIDTVSYILITPHSS